MAKRTKTAKTANCRRCHALLTNRRSVERGITDHCLREEAREAAERAARREAVIAAAVAEVDTSAFKDPQAARDKAEQLILDEAIVATRFPGVYLTTGSDGVSTYLTDSVDNTCTCKGYGHHGRCHHLVAASALELLADTSLALAA